MAAVGVLIFFQLRKDLRKPLFADRVALELAQQAQQHRQLEQLKPLVVNMAAQLDQAAGQARYLPMVQQIVGGAQ